MIGMAQRRRAVHRAAQLYAVEVIVHMMSTSFVDMPQPMRRCERICFSNPPLFGIL